MPGSFAAIAVACSIPALAGAAPLQISLEGSASQRLVPLDVHEPAAERCTRRCPVILFGSGYRAEPADYSFLLGALAGLGYLVVGIQHDLPQDPPMPSTGDIQRDRQPFWSRGVDTVRFVAQSLERRFPHHDWGSVTLSGHSQGGDIAAQLASATDFDARALWTLDNRRVPLPRRASLPVLTIRSADQPADPGVLPDPSTPAGTNVCVVGMPSTRHDDMNNEATQPAKERMVEVIAAFLQQGRCLDQG